MLRISCNYNLSFLLTLAFTLMLSSLVRAQDKGIFELNNNANVNTSSRAQFYELAFHLYPTTYIKNGVITKVHLPNIPSKKLSITGSKGLNTLYTNSVKFSNVELLYLSIEDKNDLNTFLEVSKLSQFKTLKYIYIKCCFKCDAETIKRLVRIDTNSNVRVFYKTEIPS